MRRQTAILVVALGFFLGIEIHSRYARAGDKKSPAPITNLGEHKVFDGKVIVKVFEKDGFLDYSIKIIQDEKEGILGVWNAEEKLKKESAVWVIYPEPNNKVWVFWSPHKDGHQLRLCELKQEKEIWKSLTRTPWGADNKSAIAAMPKAMVEALPKGFVEKYKGEK